MFPSTKKIQTIAYSGTFGIVANPGLVWVPQRLLPMLEWIPGYRREWLTGRLCGHRALGSDGAGRLELRRHCWGAPAYPPLHKCAGGDRLRGPTEFSQSAVRGLFRAACSQLTPTELNLRSQRSSPSQFVF